MFLIKAYCSGNAEESETAGTHTINVVQVKVVQVKVVQEKDFCNVEENVSGCHADKSAYLSLIHI